MPIIFNKPLNKNKLSYSQYVLSLNPVAYWPMDDIGSGITDISGNNINGSWQGPVLTQQTPLINSGFSTSNQGEVGNSFANESLLRINGDVTVSVWIKLIQHSNDFHQILAIGELGNNQIHNALWSLQIHPDRRVFWWHENGSGANSYHAIMPAGSIVVGSVHHLVAVRSITNQTITPYLDGVQLSNVPYNNHPDGGSSSTVIMGQWFSNTEIFDGTLDDICIFDKALTPTEALNLYNKAL